MRHGSAHWEKRGIALRHDSYMLSQMQVQTNSPQPMMPHVEATMPTLSLMHAKSDSLLPSRPRRLARAIVRGLPLLAVALAAAAALPEPVLTRGLTLEEEDLKRAAVDRHGPTSDVNTHRKNVETQRRGAGRLRSAVRRPLARERR